MKRLATKQLRPVQQHFECPTFNKHRSAAFQIRYQVLSVPAPFFGVLFERCEMSYSRAPGACIDLLVLFHCLKTLLWRIKFSSPSLLLCARSQAVFGGIHPVKISIHTAVRSYESTTTGKPLLSSRVLYVEES